MKASLTGRNGFIGSALEKRLLSMGWTVYPMLRPDVDYVFLFGSPSSDHWFQHAMSYSFRETIDNFLNALDFCRERKIKLIYPSSGTVYGKKTPYAKCKAILDDIASCFPQEVLGVRIFAGYGPGEGHKGEYASIVYKFCQAMKNGESPIVFGDGTQTRDFIYIDDIISGIIETRDKEGIVEIGTGYNSSFNDVIQIINNVLQTKIDPVYIDKPSSYVQETLCRHEITEILHNQIHINLLEGISRILFPEKLL